MICVFCGNFRVMTFSSLQPAMCNVYSLWKIYIHVLVINIYSAYIYTYIDIYVCVYIYIHMLMYKRCEHNIFAANIVYSHPEPLSPKT